MYTATVAQIREMEKNAVASGVPEYELMCRAGYQAAVWIEKLFPQAARLVFLCGGGNNGGDALVAARYLSYRRCIIFSTRKKEQFHGCAAQAAADLPENIPFVVREKLTVQDFFNGDVIIDGLLGIGFAGDRVRDNVASFIAAVNESKLPVVALDLPSGINGDNGKAAENGAVNAAVTLTFGAPKAGLFCNGGAKLRGRLRVLDIGLQKSDAGEEVFTNCDAEKLIPRFDPDCHKNSRGRVLIWGGSAEYPGAAALCTQAALKSGAGIVRCASSADLRNRLCNAAIFRKLACGETPENWFPHSDVLVAGCGWGSDVCAGHLKLAQNFEGNVIFDADALNGFARDITLWKKRGNTLITPHPGEASRLLATLGEDVRESRKENALILAQKLATVVLYKGRDTVIAEPAGRVLTVAAGSPLLATAGSGDVLAGIIGALASQGVPLFEAAALGAYIHGIAGENAGFLPIADDLPLLASHVIGKLQSGLNIV